MKDIIALIAIIVVLVLLVLICGCQSVTHVEFYEPTSTNAEYSTPHTEKSLGHGPVKSISGKSGVPDFSDGKSFNLIVNAFSL